MDNISMGLKGSDDLSISDSSEESGSTALLSESSSQIFTAPFFSLNSIRVKVRLGFCPLATIAIASSAGLLHSLMYFHSFFVVFAFSNWSMCGLC